MHSRTSWLGRVVSWVLQWHELSTNSDSEGVSPDEEVYHTMSKLQALYATAHAGFQPNHKVTISVTSRSDMIDSSKAQKHDDVHRKYYSRHFFECGSAGTAYGPEGSGRPDLILFFPPGGFRFPPACSSLWHVIHNRLLEIIAYSMAELFRYHRCQGPLSSEFSVHMGYFTILRTSIDMLSCHAMR